MRNAGSGDQDYGPVDGYYGSVGAITEESVKKYTENQKSNIGGTE